MYTSHSTSFSFLSFFFFFFFSFFPREKPNYYVFKRMPGVYMRFIYSLEISYPGKMQTLSRCLYDLAETRGDLTRTYFGFYAPF